MERQAHRLGFTLIEAVMVLLIVATVIGALAPSVVRQISHARVNRAANVVAADFFQAQSLAGRQQKPVVFTVDSSARTITVASAAGTTLYTRRLGLDSEFKLTTLIATVSPILILPNGTASTSTTVSIASTGYSRQVRMSRAGQVRVL